MSWPKLSETLPGPREPGRCQGCGADLGLVRWRECDEFDFPTETVLVTCASCDREHVTPAERLYRQMAPHEYHPGSLPFCQGCGHRRGLVCLLAKANGGPGVLIGPPPTRMHVQRSPRRLSGWVTLWRPAERCSGLKVPALAGAGGGK